MTGQVVRGLLCVAVLSAAATVGWAFHHAVRPGRSPQLATWPQQRLVLRRAATTTTDDDVGRWVELGGNFILRPPPGTPAKALVHFLGGAFVGAAPHLSYRYLLSGLAEEGFLIVTTPYQLNFDYLEICDTILETFERAAKPLAQEYGALPVVGVGHSCGALLQVFVTCLFPDTPRAANALISFNNKPAKDAIPAFEELVVPLASAIMANTTEGERFRQSVSSARSLTDTVVDTLAGSVPASMSKGLLPEFKQGLQVLDQVPGLLGSISGGVREFSPTPDDTKESCRRMYRARRTLLIKFENDAIDESDELEQVLREAKDIMRLKRPMIEFDLKTKTITGTHVTPLTQDVFLPTPIDDIDPLMPVRSAARSNFLKTVDGVNIELVEWLGEFTP